MDRFELIKRNTQEIIEESELKELLKNKKNPTVYLGTSITGRPHIGYYVWVLKLADFIKAGFKVKLLLADIHGALDNTPWSLLEKRYEYYKIVIPAMFESIGVDLKNFEMIRGSDFQLKDDYVFDILKMSTLTSVNDCKRAASEVVKFGDNPKLSGLIYPIMQSLDEQYLEVDVQYGGIDQRKILMFAREYLPKMGYKARVEVMTPLIPGLSEGGKMSSSIKESKVDLIDDEKTVSDKLKNAFCPIGVVENNGVLAFVKYVVFPIKEKFTINRDKKFGGDVIYKTYEDLEKDFVDKKLHPQDLKNSLAKEINLLLNPIRKKFDNAKNKKILEEAYSEK
ncbi:MAG: tyrosine--tRNA ligase [Candidatus Nanoarchaeia archaeon]|nr:tyrosine--tRNA ligase [Candidatus Nanoarchaeia archaeon]